MQLCPLDAGVPIFRQLQTDESPVILVNIFQVAEADIPALLEAWAQDALWMKRQPGFISTQLHQGIAGSTVLMNYAVWESVAHFRTAFNNPEFKQAVEQYPSSLWRRRIYSRASRSRTCVSGHRFYLTSLGDSEPFVL